MTTALDAARGPLRAAIVAASLGWGSGALAILGASALLGQIGLAIGSASVAIAVACLLRAPVAAGSGLLVWPSTFAAAGLTVLACTSGELHWTAAVPLLLVASATRLVPDRPEAPWRSDQFWSSLV